MTPHASPLDIALTLTDRLGVKGVCALLERFGSAEAIFSASADELLDRGEGLAETAARDILRRTMLEKAERELKYLDKHGITAIASTSELYPRLLRETPDYPHVLYVQGDVHTLNHSNLTMVGTRRMSPYGQQMCDRLIEQLKARAPHITLVSGLAFGIDTAAHRAALREDMRTVAVLASVLPQITPAQHIGVAREIVERGGAVISELNTQTHQNGRFYLARNRVLAGMSAGTVLVESPREGGAMATVALADGYNRTVMAVPGRATDAAAAGCNFLIRSRAAAMVCTGEDVVREMMWDLSQPEQLVERTTRPALELTRDEAGLLGCFGHSTDPLHTEELGALTGMEIRELAPLLLGLEMAGAVKQLPGNRYMKL